MKAYSPEGAAVAQQESDLKRMLAQLRTRLPEYERARRYYEGDHELIAVGPEYLATFRDVLEHTTYNRCRTIVDVHADKLQVTGFIDEQGDQGLGQAAKTIWQRNRMDRRAGEVHGEAFGLGDGYVIVWPDANNQALIYPQDGDRCIVRYSEADLSIDLALKVWRRADNRWRANLYYPDRVEKYLSLAKSNSVPSSGFTWEEFRDEDTVWPLPYPWGEGMPVFHFGNNARSGRFGVSELADVIPLQDALNKSLANMVIAGEFASIPQRYVIGLAMERDPQTGEYVNPFRNIPGELWWLGPGDGDSGQASFGEFRVGDITQFTAEQDSLDLKISKATRVPLHYLGMTGDFPSGESLKTAEAPWTAKIRDRQTAFGNVWEDVVAFCIRLELGRDLDAVQLSTQWQSAEPRSELDFWTVAGLKITAGVPEAQVWREAGYSEELIVEWEKLAEERKAQLAEQLQRAMNDQPPLDDAGDDEGAPAAG